VYIYVRVRDSLSVIIHLEPCTSVYMIQYVTCAYVSAQSVNETERWSNEISVAVL